MLNLQIRFRDCEPGFYQVRDVHDTQFHGDYLELTPTEVLKEIVDVPDVGKRPLLLVRAKLHHSLLVDGVNIPCEYSTMSMNVIKSLALGNPCEFLFSKMSVTIKRYSITNYTWYWPIFKSETGKIWEPK